MRRERVLNVNFRETCGQSRQSLASEDIYIFIQNYDYSDILFTDVYKNAYASHSYDQLCNAQIKYIRMVHK